MRLLILVAAFLFLPAVSELVLGVDIYEAPPGKRSPSHLVPVPPAAGNRYEALIHEHLISKWGDGSFGTMLLLPSFGPERCVSIYEVGENGKKTYMAVAAKTSENLFVWATKKARNEPVEEIHVTTKSKVISSKLAFAIQRVWAHALQLTRYPASAQELATDGVTYRFSVFVGGLGDLHGQCHSPRDGLPMQLVEMGSALWDLVGSDKTSETLTEDQLIERLKKLEATIPKP